MTPSTVPHRHAVGIHRRELLQVGFSGLLGIGLAGAVRAGATATPAVRKPKSVLIVFLTGAPSHLDTFDMKPEAPAEIRGDFKIIGAKTPGLHVCEHLSRLAARSDKYAVVRTMAHRENNHLVATHHVLTGYPQPGAFFDKVASRDDWPCYSAGLNYFRPRGDGLPSGVNLPTFLVEGPLTWPGQHAGILGPRHDPWQITRDPNSRDFRVDNLTLAPGMTVDQLGNRLSLLDEVNRQQEWLANSADGRRLSDQQQRAFTVLTSGKVARAFEMDREPAHVRERYGRHAFGQSLLLARRLIQAGVPVVQANMGRVQNWDSHNDIFSTLKGRLVPPLDQAAARSCNACSMGERLGDCPGRRMRSGIGIIMPSPKTEIPMTVALEVDLPADLARFRLPDGVATRLQTLLDRQDSGQPLTPQERAEAEGLVNLSELLTLLRLRAERMSQ
jgi:hypothetical protein